jgi:hypothetical protein
MSKTPPLETMKIFVGERMKWQVKGFLAAVIAAIVLPVSAYAVQVKTWNFSTEREYSTGTFQHTLVNNYGNLLLSHRVKALLHHPLHGLINGVAAAPNGDIYFGTSPNGKIYKIHRGKLAVFYVPPRGQRQVLALQMLGGHHLLAALCGGHSALVELSLGGHHPKARVLFSNPKVRYIWDIQIAKDGDIYLATGPHGEIWKLTPHHKSHLLASIPVHNIMALAFTRNDKHLVAGTDGAGLVLKIDPVSGRSFVLMSAGHAEISSLAIGRRGTIYAATASPNLAKSSGGFFKTQAKPDGMPASVPSLHMGGGKPGKKAAPLHMGHIPMPMMTAATEAQPYPGTGGSKKLNAVYAIDRSGRVVPVLAEPDMILAMVYQHGALILGTGPNGRLISYDPDSQTQTLLQHFKDHDILAMARAVNGELILGTANQGQIYQVGPGQNNRGSYISPVLNAKLPANWGVPHVTAVVPHGDSVAIETRSGNVKSADKFAKFWSRWSAPIPANSYQSISSPPAKYLQFRLLLKTKPHQPSPVVQSVKIGYQQINVAPNVSSITVSPLIDGKHSVTVNWVANDPNGDTLAYSLYYRQRGIPVWIRIARHLTDNTYQFATAGLPDGQYRIKVVASDAPSNPRSTALATARKTNWFTVVNTNPYITNLKASIAAGGRVTITGIAHSHLVAVKQVAIEVDSSDHWQPAAGSNSIMDSPLEAFSAETRALSAGAHRIVVRVTDAQGNRSYRSILVNIHG